VTIVDVIGNVGSVIQSRDKGAVADNAENVQCGEIRDGLLVSQTRNFVSVR
jgi:hypothetical protein